MKRRHVLLVAALDGDPAVVTYNYGDNFYVDVYPRDVDGSLKDGWWTHNGTSHTWSGWIDLGGSFGAGENLGNLPGARRGRQRLQRADRRPGSSCFVPRC